MKLNLSTIQSEAVAKARGLASGELHRPAQMTDAQIEAMALKMHPGDTDRARMDRAEARRYLRVVDRMLCVNSTVAVG